MGTWTGKSIEERFWDKVELIPFHECWEWKGKLNGSNWPGNQYGRFYVDPLRRDVKAHRFSLELHTGKRVPKHLSVCHSCDNPGCVNPKHLWVGTHQQNMIDCNAKGRRWRAYIKGPRRHKISPIA